MHLTSTLLVNCLSLNQRLKNRFLLQSDIASLCAKVNDYLQQKIQEIRLQASGVCSGFLKGFDRPNYGFHIPFLCVGRSDELSTKKLVELVENSNNSDSNNGGHMERLIVGYGRVSSREQAEDTHALEQQITRLKDAGAELIFKDIETGKKDDRKAYQRMMQLVREGKVDTLIITRLDRISRSLITIKKIIDELQAHGVNFTVLDQRISVKTSQDKLILNVLATLAEWEVDLLSERVRHGKAHRRRQNLANGSRPFGYTVENGKYVLDQTPYLCFLGDRPAEKDEEGKYPKIPGRTLAEVARDCVEVYLERRSVRRALALIFEKYGVSHTRAKQNGSDRVLHWTQRGFSLWIQNPVLDGHTCYGKEHKNAEGKVRLTPRKDWDIRYNTHPDQRLFKDGEADEILQTIEDNQVMGAGAFHLPKKQRSGYRNYSYQIGLIYCAECGTRCLQKKVYYQPKSKSRIIEYGYYGCRYSKLGCQNTESVKQPNIESALIAALVNEALQLNQRDEQPETPQPKQSKRLRRLEEQLAFFQKFPGFHPEAAQMRVLLETEIEQEKNFFHSDRMDDKSVEEIIQLGSNLGVWQQLSNQEKVQVYRRIVERILIRDGQVDRIIFKSAAVEEAN